MNDVRRVYVTLEPRHPTERVFSAASLQAALERLSARSPRAASRFAVWTAAPTPGRDHDVVVCVPVAPFENRRAQDEAAVARWDATWLLLESVPHQHRDAARQHLVDEVSMALLASAIQGVDEPGGEDDEDVGF